MASYHIVSSGTIRNVSQCRYLNAVIAYIFAALTRSSMAICSFGPWATLRRPGPKAGTVGVPAIDMKFFASVPPVNPPIRHFRLMTLFVESIMISTMG